MAKPDVFTQALRALDGGRGVAIACVIGAHGSTPRHLGARMAVAADGEQWGTVGGGRIEQLVVGGAREVAGGAPPRVVRQHLVRDLAMCCGGAMEVVLTPATGSRAALAALAGDRTPRILETPIDGAPLAIRPPAPGDPRPHHPVIRDGVLVERLGAAERAIILGLGHVARHLGPLLAGLGFNVVVCDDGETGATEAGVAWASETIESFDPAEIERRVGGFSVDDCVLIVTRDHAIDQQLLEHLLVHDEIGYLGMIGSRGKVGRFHKRLAARGLLDGELGRARWARLHAPIGLNLGAETPEEIAVAIAAELIAIRRRGATTAADWSPLRIREAGS
ncbi:MAG TPA: XdhC family protein [Kofleriaceae bacterium]|jgi:xanthine dehydrogenase accessory factor|nr:XdhC family protein [Kofleriaceae bacterium]